MHLKGTFHSADPNDLGPQNGTISFDQLGYEFIRLNPGQQHVLGTNIGPGFGTLGTYEFISPGTEIQYHINGILQGLTSGNMWLRATGVVSVTNIRPDVSAFLYRRI